MLEPFENYVDGISADNNAEFEFLRIKRKQSVQCWAQALPQRTLAWCLSELDPFGISV